MAQDDEYYGADQAPAHWFTNKTVVEVLRDGDWPTLHAHTEEQIGIFHSLGASRPGFGFYFTEAETEMVQVSIGSWADGQRLLGQFHALQEDAIYSGFRKIVAAECEQVLERRNS